MPEDIYALLRKKVVRDRRGLKEECGDGPKAVPGGSMERGPTDDCDQNPDMTELHAAMP